MILKPEFGKGSDFCDVFGGLEVLKFWRFGGLFYCSLFCVLCFLGWRLGLSNLFDRRHCFVE